MPFLLITVHKAGINIGQATDLATTLENTVDANSVRHHPVDGKPTCWSYVFGGITDNNRPAIIKAVQAWGGDIIDGPTVVLKEPPLPSNPLERFTVVFVLKDGGPTPFLSAALRNRTGAMNVIYPRREPVSSPLWTVQLEGVTDAHRVTLEALRKTIREFPHVIVGGPKIIQLEKPTASGEIPPAPDVSAWGKEFGDLFEAFFGKGTAAPPDSPDWGKAVNDLFEKFFGKGKGKKT